MKKLDTFKIVLIVLIGIALNIAGKFFAIHYGLPVWMDAFGTAVAAYILGPVSGAAVGLSSNVIFNILSDSYLYLYGIVNVVIGIIIGVYARKGSFKTFFGTVSVSTMVTAVALILSTPLNFLYHKGMVGNPIGNGIVEFLLREGINKYVANVVGGFYIDFVDKTLTLGLLAILLCVWRVISGFLNRNDKADKENQNDKENKDNKENKENKDVKEKNDDDNKNKAVKNGGLKNAVSVVVLIMTFMIGIHFTGNPVCVKADESEENIDFHSYFQTVYNSENGLTCGTANDIAETNDGILWIGSYAGLYRYNGREFKWMNSFDSVKNVNCLFVDPEGRLWIGTNDNGLSVSINETITNTLDEEHGLPSNTVRSITMSSDGYYYIGTASSIQVLQLSGGMNLMNEIDEVVDAKSMSADGNGNVVAVTSKGNLYLINDREVIEGPRQYVGDKFFTSCLFAKDGYLYVSNSGNEIYRYRMKDGKLIIETVLMAKDLNHINNMYESKGNLFVCADNGVGYFDLKDNFRIVNTNSFNNSIDDMIMDYQGDYWLISSRLGMLRMSPSSFSKMYGYSGTEEKVVNTVERWHGKLYIGTDKGLDILNSKGVAVYNDPIQEAVGEVRIRCIEADETGGIWISTYGKGLLNVNQNGKLIWYNAEKKFSDWIRCTRVLSDGTVAVSTDIGLSFIKDGKVDYSIPFGKDFLESKILCILEMQDGRLLVGSDGDGIAILKDGKVERKIKTSDGLSSNVILRIVKAKKDAGYFVVASNGLNYLSEDGVARELNNFPYYNNYDMWESDDGTAFVLGSAGIYVMSESDIVADTENPSYELLDSRRGLLDAITANSWNCVDSYENLYISTDVGVYKLNMKDYGSMKKSFRMKVTSAVLDGTPLRVERGTEIVLDRDNARLELNPEIINYTVEDPIIQYMLIGFDNEMTEVPSSELSTIVYTNLPTGKYTFRMTIVDNDKNVIEESVYKIVKEEEIYDHWWFRSYMIIVGGLAIAWFTWFIARTKIQRTLEYQRRELSFAMRQLELGNQTILAIAKTVDKKDENTSLHSQRVSEYSVMLAKELGFTPGECENIRRAGLLHDIGKIGIPDRVLNKKGKLDDEEYALMKTHVTHGGEILKDFTLIEHAADGAMYHHEKYDGTGYMMGLKGEEIPLYGRIIAVADAFDAMTQNRVYREKQDISYVRNELERCSGTQFDPKIAAIMLRFIDEGKVPIKDKDLLKSMKKHEQEDEERLHEED